MPAETDRPHFTLRDEVGAVVEQVTPETMRPFLDERADGSGGAVELVATPGATEATAGRRAGANPEGAGGWRVRVVEGGRELTGRAPNTDALFDLFRSWAAGDDWWREAFSWEPVG